MKQTVTILTTAIITVILTLVIIAIILLGVNHAVKSKLFQNQNKKFLFLHKASSVQAPRKVVNVLVVSGGGVMGILPLGILEYVEQRSGIKIADSFDLFAGTSTGALIASAYANNLEIDGKMQPPTTADIMAGYFQLSHKIFSQSFSHQLKTGFGLFGALYDHAALKQGLENKYHQIILGDARKPLIFPSFDLKTGDIVEFSSWKRNAPYAKTPTYQLLLGATSAPVAFPPYKLTFVGQNESNVLVDGGLVANTPSMMAYFAARKLYPNSNIRIISIGDGSYKDILMPEESALGSMGFLAWGHILINVFVHSHTLLSQDYLEDLINEPGSHLVDYYRINMNIPVKNHGVFDGSKQHLIYLKNMAEEYTRVKKNELDELAAKLKTS
ncbi:MAG: hypothetical protein CMF39_05940 [Legionellaceae bacterium]|nr:hypothetical protein [Legionellaceae bacterium]|tara:strand:- start:199 stop:1353 length:1155 start_codon:yes stop_codon:yes gene_type:complete